MTRFVASHFVYGVVNSVEILLFGKFGEFDFTCGSAVFGGNAEFEIFLGRIGNDFAEKFCKFGCVFGLFPSRFFIIRADFGITFPISDSRHGKIHAYFAALAFKIHS